MASGVRGWGASGRALPGSGGRQARRLRYGADGCRLGEAVCWPAGCRRSRCVADGWRWGKLDALASSSAKAMEDRQVIAVRGAVRRPSSLVQLRPALQFKKNILKIMKLTSADLRYSIYDLRVVGAGIKGMARPQSARCAGKICRSATNSTFAAGRGRLGAETGLSAEIRRNPTIEFFQPT